MAQSTIPLPSDWITYMCDLLTDNYCKQKGNLSVLVTNPDNKHCIVSLIEPDVFEIRHNGGTKSFTRQELEEELLTYRVPQPDQCFTYSTESLAR